jgi:hypothetical protein
MKTMEQVQNELVAMVREQFGEYALAVGVNTKEEKVKPWLFSSPGYRTTVLLYVVCAPNSAQWQGAVKREAVLEHLRRYSSVFGVRVEWHFFEAAWTAVGEAKAAS